MRGNEMVIFNCTQYTFGPEYKINCRYSAALSRFASLNVRGFLENSHEINGRKDIYLVDISVITLVSNL